MMDVIILVGVFIVLPGVIAAVLLRARARRY